MHKVMRKCGGCGKEMHVRELVAHRESQCRASRITPGMKFWIIARTWRAGKQVRRKIEVEIMAPLEGGGWIVRSTETGRYTHIKSPQRIIDWNSFQPGLNNEPELRRD